MKFCAGLFLFLGRTGYFGQYWKFWNFAKLHILIYGKMSILALKCPFWGQSRIKHTHSILFARAYCILFIQLGMYDFEKNTKPKSIKRALSWFFLLLKWKTKIPTLCSFCKIKDCLKWLMVFWSIINTECMISPSDF